MKTIDQLIDELIDREGGYVNDPADSGGATNFGITEEVARHNGYHGDMRSLPRSMAAAIYTRDYWTLPGFDQVATVYPRVAAELFDTGVNMGPKVAGGYLQRILNALNVDGKEWLELRPDGDVGPGTMAALRGFRSKRGLSGEEVLLTALNALQGERYIELAEANHKDQQFLYGWLANRVSFA